MSPLPFDPSSLYKLKVLSIPLERPSWSTLERYLDLDPVSAASPFLPAWINKCVYQCRLCGELRGAQSQLELHRCYKKRFDCFERTITDLHSCKICHVRIVCDQDSLERHLQDDHSASLQDYVSYVNLMVRAANSFYSPGTEEETAKTPQTPMKSKKRIRCAMCGLTFSRHEQAAVHVASSHVDVVNNADDCITDIMYTNCLLCDAKVTDDELGLGAHLANEHNTTMISYCNVFARSLKDRT